MENKIKMSVLNEVSQIVHHINLGRGFYDEPRELGTLLMLINSELCEALEADRHDKCADMEAFKEATKGHEVGSLEWVEAFDAHIKDTFEDEIADTFLRLFDLCGYLGINIDDHILSKIAYNETRPYKNGKRY